MNESQISPFKDTYSSLRKKDRDLSPQNRNRDSNNISIHQDYRPLRESPKIASIKFLHSEKEIVASIL